MASQPRRAARPSFAVACVLWVGAIVAMYGCGDDASSSGTDAGEGCAVAEIGVVTIVAEDVAWDVDCLRAPAHEPLTIRVDNRDAGVNHNLHVTGLPDKPSTELEVGPVVQELAIPAKQLAPGRYGYVCDIHPNMIGTLEIAPAAPQGDVATPR